MQRSFEYNVVTWPEGDAHEDIGAVLNSIIADVKQRQQESSPDGHGKPGAVITIPPGDFVLRTPVLIDVSFLRIQGSGHGFTSSSIRFNEPADRWKDLHELWPGGSRVLVTLDGATSRDGEDRAAFVVTRGGSPRISSVELSGFCIDGLHFEPNGRTENPENSYCNGKTGILIKGANDSFRISEMGLVYLEHGVVVAKADALSVHDNFIAECGSCIELTEWGQASKVTDNLLGAGPWGRTVYAEHHGGLLITANNVFPRGDSSIQLSATAHSSITGNRLHSFYPGAVRLLDGSTDNLVASNHVFRDYEPWEPFIGIGNGLDEAYGAIRIDGDANAVIGNQVSVTLTEDRDDAAASVPVVIRLAGGSGNYVASNHIVVRTVRAARGESAFESQVDALTGTGHSGRTSATTVLVDEASQRNTVLDSGTDEEVVMDRAVNAFRPTPAIGG